MRRTASEKTAIIRLVEGTDLPVRAALRQLGVARSTFYGWYQQYVMGGVRWPARQEAWSSVPLERDPGESQEEGYRARS